MKRGGGWPRATARTRKVSSCSRTTRCRSVCSGLPRGLVRLRAPSTRMAPLALLPVYAEMVSTWPRKALEPNRPTRQQRRSTSPGMFLARIRSLRFGCARARRQDPAESRRFLGLCRTARGTSPHPQTRWRWEQAIANPSSARATTARGPWTCAACQPLTSARSRPAASRAVANTTSAREGAERNRLTSAMGKPF
jgi:hypothetical protein